MFIMSYLAITIHEAGHICTAALMNRKTYCIRLMPIGTNAVIDESTCTCAQKVLIYLCGPVVNILFFLILVFVNSYYPFEADSMRFFIYTNLYLALFNLLPVYPLDGSRIARELIAARRGIFVGSRYLKLFSSLFSLMLVLAGIFELFRSINGMNLILLGVYVFFILRTEYNGEAAFMTIKDIIYRQSRFAKRGVYPVRDLAVLKSVRIGEIIKSMDFDRFHILYILDDNYRLLKIYTEHEIIELVMKNGGDITFGEMLDNVE